MKISFPSPPQAVTNALAESFTPQSGGTFEPMHSPSGTRLLASRSAALGGSTPTPFPHREFTIPSDKLSEPNPLSFAKERGWRALSITDKGESGARLVKSTENGDVKTVQFNVGPFPENTRNAVSRLRRMSDEGYYEFRFLILPSVRVAAAWLHGPSENKFMALKPAHDGMPTDELLNEQIFFERVASIVASEQKTRSVSGGGTPRISREQIYRRLVAVVQRQLQPDAALTADTSIQNLKLGSPNEALPFLNQLLERSAFGPIKPLLSLKDIAQNPTISDLANVLWSQIPEDRRL